MAYWRCCRGLPTNPNPTHGDIINWTNALQDLSVDPCVLCGHILCARCLVLSSERTFRPMGPCSCGGTLCWDCPVVSRGGVLTVGAPCSCGHVLRAACVGGLVGVSGGNDQGGGSGDDEGKDGSGDDGMGGEGGAKGEGGKTEGGEGGVKEEEQEAAK